MDSAGSRREIGVSPFADSAASSSPSNVSIDHIPIDVLFESTSGGILEFFLDSDEEERIGMSRVLPDDEIVDPRVKVETVSESASSPPRSRRKHLGVRSDDFLWDKPVEDFFSSKNEWIVSSWQLYPKSSVHVLDLTNGKTVYMFVDKVYPIRATVPPSYCRDVVVAVKESFQTVQAGLSKHMNACTARQMVFSSPWLTAKKEFGSPLQTALVCNSNPLIAMVSSCCAVHLYLLGRIVGNIEKRTMYVSAVRDCPFLLMALSGICWQFQVAIPKNTIDRLHEMKPFGCPITILNTRDHLGKFEGKAYEGFFVGYSMVSKAMRVFNKRTRIVEETLNIRFLENASNVTGNGPDWLFDVDSLSKSMNYVPVVAGNQTNGIAETRDNIVAGQAEKKTEPEQEYILIPICITDPLISQGPQDGEEDAGVKPTEVYESEASDKMGRMNKTQEEPKKVIQALEDPSLIEAMQEELLQFELQKVWALVDLPNGKRAIGTKWVFRNKKDERGIVVRNKARMMDVKSAFLYGTIEKEVAWYETLSTYLLENGYRRGTIDKTLFIKKDKNDAQDILDEFYGEAHFLLRITTSRPDIMFAVCACARFQVTPKVSHLHAVKRIFIYLKGQPKLGLWYPRDSPFDLEAFSDSDYAGSRLDRRSTTGGCQFLGKRLISWECKKQTIVVNSTTEEEYVAAANCCGQVLWIQNQMLDYGFNFMNTKIHIDNESIIYIVKSPVFHSKTKHIEIRHHFIRDSYEKKLIQVIKIYTDHNVLDLLTKAFDVSRKAKRTTKISQSSGPIHLVADETVYKEWEDRMERAATTASSLVVEQDNGSGPRCPDTILGGAEAQISLPGQTSRGNVQAQRGLCYTFPHQEVFCEHKRHVKFFSRVTPLFSTMMVQATKDMGADSATPTDSRSTPIISQPSSSKPQNKKSRRKQRKDSGPTEPVTDEAHVPAYKEKSIYPNREKLKDLVADAEVTFVSVVTTTKSIPVSAAEVVTTASVEIPDELTLAQNLIEIKTVKPKFVTTAVTTVTSVRPRAKGIIFHDQEEQVPASTKTFSSSQSQLPQLKDKGKGEMVDPEKPLKKKDQIALDEEIARNLKAQMQAELIKEERLARQKEEETNIVLIESWDNTQAMMEADFELAQRLQAEEHGEITIEERYRLFVELMNRRKKHFAKLRAEEIRRNPPSKAQKRNQMSTYLKNMAGFKHSQLKNKGYDEIQRLFDKEMKRVNTFVDMNIEVVKGSETRTEESSKRAGDELESDKSKK
ncbi:putative ribonuclease H-like domain-containing protein [Tanacetum coccineum]|uniref:Ribonuclease H-like domain-containing protein n=1 Tax=Tanacetum coccineum TaxID=301880 RepID=A0ABQ5ALP8_9ASTR